jgi:hypothetical protein
MFGFKKYDMIMALPYRRKLQPTSWNEILLKRDGVEPKSTVTIYRSTQSNVLGGVMQAETREIVDQKIISPLDLETFGVEEDPQFMGEGENEKELLVVVKRGRGVDILQHDVAPFSNHDIRQWADGMTWQEIRKAAIDRFYEENDDYFGFEDEDKEDKNVEVDKYSNVDDYVWDNAVSFNYWYDRADSNQRVSTGATLRLSANHDIEALLVEE